METETPICELNNKSVDVSIVILNWNGASLLRKFLPSVVENIPSDIAKVIVADNGSTDDSLSVLAKEFPGVEVIKLDKNYGFAEGYNRALERIESKYTVLLNSDVETPKGWLSPLYNYMKAHPDCGGCQPKILSYNDKTKFEYAGASGGYLDCNGYPYCRGRIFDTCETDCGQYDDIVDIHWATGAALMVDTKLYKQVGGLDERFFAHMEEIDLCWRIRLSGRSLSVVPQSVVYHLGGATLNKSNPRKTYLNFRNSLLMLHKNLPAGECKSAIFRRKLLDGIAGMKFLVSGHFGDVRAIVKAHKDFNKMSAAYKNHPDNNLLSGERNILVEYYIKGRKKYSELKRVYSLGSFSGVVS